MPSRVDVFAAFLDYDLPHKLPILWNKKLSSLNLENSVWNVTHNFDYEFQNPQSTINLLRLIPM